MEKIPVIVGIGELLWDELPTGRKMGGAPVNFVYHASQLGVESYAISAVGKDDLGDRIVEELERYGLKYIVERVDFPTGTVQVTLDNGDPSYLIPEDVAWDSQKSRCYLFRFVGTTFAGIFSNYLYVVGGCSANGYSLF